MKVTIEYNDKKIDVELTAEQIKKLGLQEEKKTGWERAEYDKVYYRLANSLNRTWSCTENNTSEDNDRYNNGNYFTDKNLAEKMNKCVRLMLRMQRWADEHNETLGWNNSYAIKYRIGYNIKTKELEITSSSITKSIGVVYFSSYGLAEKAIEEFGDEIIDCYGESGVTR